MRQGYKHQSLQAGGKRRPFRCNRLAHYLEHMLFKGTDKYGTINFIEEKPILDKIEDLYEEYRKVPMSNISEREKFGTKSIHYQMKQQNLQ